MTDQNPDIILLALSMIKDGYHITEIAKSSGLKTDYLTKLVLYFSVNPHKFNDLIELNSSSDISRLHDKLKDIFSELDKIGQHHFLTLNRYLNKDLIYHNLNPNEIFSLSYILANASLTTQQARFKYSAELILQINQLLRDHDRQEVAEMMGYDKDNISRIKKRYKLPRNNFGLYSGQLNSKIISEDLEMKLQSVYIEFKYLFIPTIDRLFLEGKNAKQIATLLGMHHDKVRKWKKEYGLPILEPDYSVEYLDDFLQDDDYNYDPFDPAIEYQREIEDEYHQEVEMEHQREIDFYKEQQNNEITSIEEEQRNLYEDDLYHELEEHHLRQLEDDEYREITEIQDQEEFHEALNIDDQRWMEIEQEELLQQELEENQFLADHLDELAHYEDLEREFFEDNSVSNDGYYLGTDDPAGGSRTHLSEEVNDLNQEFENYEMEFDEAEDDQELLYSKTKSESIDDLTHPTPVPEFGENSADDSYPNYIKRLGQRWKYFWDYLNTLDTKNIGPDGLKKPNSIIDNMVIENSKNKVSRQKQVPEKPKANQIEDIVDQIIELLSQGYTIKQIAKMLNLDFKLISQLITKYASNPRFKAIEINPAAALTPEERIREVGVGKTKTPVSTVGTLIRKIPFLSMLEIYQDIPMDTVFNMDFLRKRTNLPDQSIRNKFRTELLLQMNELYLHFKTPDVAKMMGYAARNIYHLQERFHLPQKYFGVYNGELNAKQMAQKLQVDMRWIYDVYKFSFLPRLNQKLIQGIDAKTAGKELGLVYDKVRKWIKEYNLPILDTEFQQLLASQKVTEEEIWKKQMKFDPGTDTRTIEIGPDTRLFRPNGEVVFAKELVGISKKNLKARGPFLMFNDNHELVYSYIDSAKRITVDQAYHIKTKSGNDLVVGDVSLLCDLEEGILPTTIKDLAAQVQNNEAPDVFELKSLQMLPSPHVTFFDLLEEKENPEIKFIMKPDVHERIKGLLKARYKDIKRGCLDLYINYRNFVEHGYLSHKNLTRLNEILHFPDTKSENFMALVDKIGIAGKKIDVNNPQLDNEMLYLFGLLASDGYLLTKQKSAFAFSNKDLTLINAFKDILLLSFPTRHIKIRDPEPPEKVTYELITYNNPMVRISNNLQIKGNDVVEESAYLPLLKFPLNNIAYFIRGFFDGDGSVDLSARMISIEVFNPDGAKNLQLLLKRFNIQSTVEYSERWTSPPFTEKKYLSKKWDIRISGKGNLLKFLKFIGSHHPKKDDQLNELEKILANQKGGSSTYDLAPKFGGKILKTIRKKSGMSLQKTGFRDIIFRVENSKGRTSVKNLKEILEFFKKLENVDNAAVIQLEEILNSNLKQDKVTSIELSKDNSNFIQIRLKHNLVVDGGLTVTSFKH